jgi:hypothetical protein
MGRIKGEISNSNVKVEGIHAITLLKQRRLDVTTTMIK